MKQSSSVLRNLRSSTSGNVMYLVAGLLLPILATVGAGVDMGQAYMAKSRLQQACDAGVLSGRRVMAAGSYDSQARNAAKAMFEFNFPNNIYGSKHVVLNSQQQGAAEVQGTATAEVDTLIMNMFGKETFDLSVSCVAKLEISNADIMFVLDTTGSMLTADAGGGLSRIQAVRNEVMAFYDTVQAAQSGTSVIRYGVMPYSSNVNVGNILRGVNSSWISNSVDIPTRGSRVANYVPFSGFTAWANTGTTISGKNSTTCPATVRNPQYTYGTATTGAARTNTVSGWTETQNFNANRFRYAWSSSACREQRAAGIATRTTVMSMTGTTPAGTFLGYTHRRWTHNVSSLLTGGGMTVPSGANGAAVTPIWNGCIMERDTVAFAAGSAVPAGAFDLDVDGTPSSEATRWHVALPNIAHPRSTNASDAVAATPTEVDTASDWQSYASAANATGGWAACPTQAMRLQPIPMSSRATLLNYVNSLVAVGGTYHDVGMVWGTRFASPTGLFADANATATNGSPISRHIIFMTDGQAAPNPGIYGFQGVEYLHGRVGSTGTTELTNRHNARFQAACAAARARNMTVWVVAFTLPLDANLTACASSPGNAFSASNATQLRTQFQTIAAQITRLRLSE